MAYAPMPVTESHRLREADDDGARRSLLSPTIASLALFGAVGLLATRHFGTTNRRQAVGFASQPEYLSILRN